MQWEKSINDKGNITKNKILLTTKTLKNICLLESPIYVCKYYWVSTLVFLDFWMDPDLPDLNTSLFIIIYSDVHT